MENSEKLRAMLWGRPARILTASKFKITQLRHYVPLFPEECLFCKEQTEIFVLLLTNPKNTNTPYTAKVGKVVAIDLLRIAGQKPIRKFNPLVSDHTSSTLSQKGPPPSSTKELLVNPLTRETFEALNLFLLINPIKNPYGIILEALEEVNAGLEHEIGKGTLFRLNAALKKFDKPLYPAIQTLRAEHHRMDNYKFPLLEKILGPENFLGQERERERHCLTSTFSSAGAAEGN